MQEKFETNRKKVDVHVSPLLSAASSRTTAGENGNSNVFSSRMEKPLCKLIGFPHGVADRDYIPTKDVISASIKLPCAERIPPYTTWIFLDRHALFCFSTLVYNYRLVLSAIVAVCLCLTVGVFTTMSSLKFELIFSICRLVLNVLVKTH